MRRQGFGSGGSVLAENGSRVCVLRPPRFLISLLVAGVAVIFFPGLARAQTGTVVFSQSTYTVDASQSNALIKVIFSGSTDATASVDFSTSNLTAVAGVDYVAVFTNLNFPAEVLTNAVLTNVVNIALLNNGVAGSTQTVNLALSNPLGPVVLGSPSTAVLTIINNELEALQFALASYSVDDADTDTVAIITLVRVGATNGTVAVDFSTSDGSAKAGIDYTATTGTVP